MRDALLRLNPPEVADVAPVDGVRVVAKMIVGQLQPLVSSWRRWRWSVPAGVERVAWRVNRGAPWLMDDATIQALNDQEGKLLTLRADGRRSDLLLD
jgi:hypothetical protein